MFSQIDDELIYYNMIKATTGYQGARNVGLLEGKITDVSN